MEMMRTLDAVESPSTEAPNSAPGSPSGPETPPCNAASKGVCILTPQKERKRPLSHILTVNLRPRPVTNRSVTAAVATVAASMEVGQEVLAFHNGQWVEATIQRHLKRRNCFEVVVAKSQNEIRVPLAWLAVKLGAPDPVQLSAQAPGPFSTRPPVKPAEAPLRMLPELCRPSKAGLCSKVLKKTDKALHAKVDNNEIPGVVSVVYRRGHLAHLDCYGYADLARKVPLRPDSIVRLYSMTKCIVSVVAAQCVEDGLLQWLDPVSKYIPAFADAKVKTEDGELVPAERPMTVLQLLTHTSGLGYGPMLGDDADGDNEGRFLPLINRANLGRTSPESPEAVRSLEQWVDEIAKIPLQSHPGTEWIYSYSHDVVGRVLEVATGQRLDTLLQERLLGPLKMVDTAFEIPKEKWDRCAGMYRKIEVEQAPSVATQTSQEPESPPSEAADQGEKSAASKNASQAGDTAADKEPTFILKRLDGDTIETHEWMAGNTSPILAGGGSVDSMTGGLVSTAVDIFRFCLMLLRKGELDGVRVLKTETVDWLISNQLPLATGKDDVWCFNNPGTGFSPLGSISVEHPDLDPTLRAPEYGWGGMAGTAWTNDPKEDFLLLSFSLVAFDLTTEEVLRAGVRHAIQRYAERKAESALKKAADSSTEPQEASAKGQLAMPRRYPAKLAKSTRLSAAQRGDFVPVQSLLAQTRKTIQKRSSQSKKAFVPKHFDMTSPTSQHKQSSPSPMSVTPSTEGERSSAEEDAVMATELLSFLAGDLTTQKEVLEPPVVCIY